MFFFLDGSEFRQELIGFVISELHQQKCTINTVLSVGASGANKGHVLAPCEGATESFWEKGHLIIPLLPVVVGK